jgi:hypothetical protein
MSRAVPSLISISARNRVPLRRGISRATTPALWRRSRDRGAEPQIARVGDCQYRSQESCDERLPVAGVVVHLDAGR